jgi:FAD-dependent urate hydroxylase
LRTNILVIGAGPLGLSISAHLRALGVEHCTVGRPMDTWRSHMPTGMKLKSEPYASEIASPAGGYDVAAYSRSRDLEYVKRQVPLSLDQFLGYADWYADALVPGVRDVTVAEITRADSEFRIAFADAEPMVASQVVVATGVLPYAHLPSELSGLPSDLLSHTSSVPEPSLFRGRRVAIVGAGQSALEAAALLQEAGTEVQLIVRGNAIRWLAANPAELGRLGHIKRPTTKLCEGWHCAFWNTPAAFRRLPLDLRVSKSQSVLGPSGAWWLKDRVEGVVDVLTGHNVKGVVATGSSVQLLLDGPERSSIDVDHVVAGTGFRVDVRRLDFVTDSLSTQIATINGYPVVSRSCESSVPGLYFVGAPATVSLGPSMRFIAATHNVARRVANAAARRAS